MTKWKSTFESETRRSTVEIPWYTYTLRETNENNTKGDNDLDMWMT